MEKIAKYETDVVCNTCELERTVKCMSNVKEGYYWNYEDGDCKYVQIHNYHAFIGEYHLICYEGFCILSYCFHGRF